MAKNKDNTNTNNSPKNEEAKKEQDLTVAAATEETKEAEATSTAESDKAEDKVEDKAEDKAKDKVAASEEKDTAPEAEQTEEAQESETSPEVSLSSSIDPSDKPVNEPFKSRVIVVTSGKGGVGKTTSAASIATGLSLQGHKTAVIDFDVGLRNLDLLLGCELRVVYDFINVLHGEARLNQALIKVNPNLFVLPASQTKDKDALTLNGVGKVLQELSEKGFEYIICDSPAGIEKGALLALYYADEAIVTTNPEVSSVRDSDRIIGIINAKSRRAINDWEPVQAKLLLTRYIPERVNMKEMLSVSDIQDLLTIPLLGVIPESKEVLSASNIGQPIILNKECDAGKAYSDAVERLLGKDVPMRFVTEKPKNFLQKLFGK